MAFIQLTSNKKARQQKNIFGFIIADGDYQRERMAEEVIGIA
jgi:hypothetical protein